MSRRNTALLIAVEIVLFIAGAIGRRNSQPEEPIDLGFDETDLTGLEDGLENLEFDDLEGIEMDDSENLTLGFNLDDLEGLKDLLEGLKFEDLEGLSEG